VIGREPIAAATSPQDFHFQDDADRHRRLVRQT
jgi:hypothetical protein